MMKPKMGLTLKETRGMIRLLSEITHLRGRLGLCTTSPRRVRSDGFVGAYQRGALHRWRDMLKAQVLDAHE